MDILIEYCKFVKKYDNPYDYEPEFGQESFLWLLNKTVLEKINTY